MKKKLLIVLAMLFVVILAAVVILPLVYLDPLVVAGVARVGPAVAKVDTKLDSASISLLSGRGTLKGFFMGNPPGYQSPFSMKAGEITMAIQPKSLLADKVVVEEFHVFNPEIAMEGGLTDNNFTRIMANVQAFTGTNQTTADDSSTKKLQVNSIVISGAKVTATTVLAGGKPLTLTLPDIKLSNLGTGPEGITAAELSAAIFKELSDKTLGSLRENALKLGAAAVTTALDQAGDEARKAAGKAVGDATKGLGDLLKKKP